MPGTARRLAFDAALREIEEGLEEPSPSGASDYSLLLGLERVLAEDARSSATAPSSPSIRSTRCRGRSRRSSPRSRSRARTGNGNGAGPRTAGKAHGGTAQGDRRG